MEVQIPKNETKVKICIIPGCEKEIQKWRKKAGRITCNKKCSSLWNHMASKKREKIRGKKYGNT